MNRLSAQSDTRGEGDFKASLESESGVPRVGKIEMGHEAGIVQRWNPSCIRCSRVEVTAERERKGERKREREIRIVRVCIGARARLPRSLTLPRPTEKKKKGKVREAERKKGTR